MRIVIAAVGRLKQGPERELAAEYCKRAEKIGRAFGLRDIEIVEIRESRAADAKRRRVEESIAIANVIPERAIIVILDERGISLDSAALAGTLREWRAEDRPAVSFVIGGADGLASSLRDQFAVSLLPSGAAGRRRTAHWTCTVEVAAHRPTTLGGRSRPRTALRR